MKYVCLGYCEPEKRVGMTEDEQQAMFDECFARVTCQFSEHFGRHASSPSVLLLPTC